MLNFLGLRHWTLCTGKRCSWYLHISSSDWAFDLLCFSTCLVSMAFPVPTWVRFHCLSWEQHKAALQTTFVVGTGSYQVFMLSLTTLCTQLIRSDFCASCQPVLASSWSSRFIFWSIPMLNSNIFFVNLTAYLEMIVAGYHCVSLATTFLG